MILLLERPVESLASLKSSCAHMADGTTIMADWKCFLSRMNAKRATRWHTPAHAGTRTSHLRPAIGGMLRCFGRRAS